MIFFPIWDTRLTAYDREYRCHPLCASEYISVLLHASKPSADRKDMVLIIFLVETQSITSVVFGVVTVFCSTDRRHA